MPQPLPLLAAGVSVYGKGRREKSIWAHHKKGGVFFVRFCLFSPFSLGCLVRFFLSRFWAFLNKGSSKTRLKKSRENLLSSQKKTKAPTHTHLSVSNLRHFFFSFV
jgi:hypothetical protein